MFVNPSNANRKSVGKTLLHASDVTTIVSIATVVIRLVTSSWCSIAAWRCAFILLEAGLDLQQFSRTVSWRMATKFRDRNSVTVASVLLLMFPSTVITPIVTGEIDWQAGFSFKNGGILMLVLVDANSSLWYWYLWHDQGSRNDDQADRAAGIASDVWANIDNLSGFMCRHKVNEMVKDSDTSIPTNSTVENAILPCLQVHDLAWDDIPWPADVLKSLQNDGQSISLAGRKPLSFWGAGNVFLYDFKPWDSKKLYFGTSPDNTSFPPPIVFSGTKKILLMIGRQWSNECKIVSSGLFGNATSMAKITNAYPLIHNPTHENCYLSGTINITAGIVKSPFSGFVSSRVIEAQQDNLPIEPSIWTEEALFQMPDVTPRITNMNSSRVPT